MRKQASLFQDQQDQELPEAPSCLLATATLTLFNVSHAMPKLLHAELRDRELWAQLRLSGFGGRGGARCLHQACPVPTLSISLPYAHSRKQDPPRKPKSQAVLGAVCPGWAYSVWTLLTGPSSRLLLPPPPSGFELWLQA